MPAVISQRGEAMAGPEGTNTRFAPSTAAAFYAKIPAGQRIQFEGYTTQGELVGGSSVWYITMGGHWFSATVAEVVRIIQTNTPLPQTPYDFFAASGVAHAGPYGANIRYEPRISSLTYHYVVAGGDLAYDGYTTNGDTVNGSSSWYHTTGGHWFSAAMANFDNAPPPPAPDPGSPFEGNLIPRSGAATAGINGVNTRFRPHLSSPLYAYVNPGVRIYYNGYTTQGDLVEGSNLWYRTTGGHWFSEKVADFGNGPTPVQTLLHKPFTGDFPCTQGFGSHPDLYKPLGLPGHDGLDFGLPDGTAVLAAAAGIVVIAEPDPTPITFRGGYGHVVIIRHSFGRTLYGHLDSFDVRAGQMVNVGQQIATSNNTGNTSGPHLHFGLKLDGHPNPGYYDFIDPAPYLGGVHCES